MDNKFITLLTQVYRAKTESVQRLRLTQLFEYTLQSELISQHPEVVPVLTYLLTEYDLFNASYYAEALGSQKKTVYLKMG